MLGDSRLPHTHTHQAPGGGSSGGGGCGRETLLPACPAPTPGPYLPAASPTARTARSCGPGGHWGPSSCGVSCPWWAREPKRSPTSPTAGPAALGGKQSDARAATADAPSPSSATPPGSSANGGGRGGAGGGAGLAHVS